MDSQSRQRFREQYNGPSTLFLTVDGASLSSGFHGHMGTMFKEGFQEKKKIAQSCSANSKNDNNIHFDCVLLLLVFRCRFIPYLYLNIQPPSTITSALCCIKQGIHIWLVPGLILSVRGTPLLQDGQGQHSSCPLGKWYSAIPLTMQCIGTLKNDPQFSRSFIVNR